MKRLFTLISLIALGAYAIVDAETNQAFSLRRVELQEDFRDSTTTPGAGDLLSLPTEHLIIFVNGKQVEGEEKELVLEKQRELRTEMHRLAGIGVVLTQRDGKFVVIPLPDTPAMKAGLLQGDVVTAIDGKSTEGLSLPDVVTRVRGVAGSTVTLSISRPRLAQPFEVKLIREEIKSHPEPSQAHEPTVKTSTIIMRKGADISPEELKRLGIITNAPSREASDER